MAISDAQRSARFAADSEVRRTAWAGVDLVAQVDLFSAAPYEVSLTKNPLTFSMH
jgi:hypothetical protein